MMHRMIVGTAMLADGSAFSIDLASTNTFVDDFVDPAAVLTVTLSLPGDYNNDGTVDAADYIVWRDALATEAVLPNDTSPGKVTQLDYDVWVANFGRVWGEAGAASFDVTHAGVPEPTSLQLALLLTAVCFRYPRMTLRRIAC